MSRFILTHKRKTKTMILRSMRNGFFSAIFLGLLVLGGFSLVLTDWNGMFRGGGITKTDIAVVDGTPIKISEFNNIVNRVLRNQQIDPAQAYQSGVLDNILQNEILTRVLAIAANDYGIRVEDKHIAKQIKSLITPLTTSETDSKQALKQFLQMQGMSEKALVSIIRSEIETELLKSSIAVNSYVPNAMSEDIAAYRDTTRTVRYIQLENKDIKLEQKADEELLKNYYEGLKSQYMIPETRDFTIALVNAEKLIKDMKASDEEIQNYYNDHLDDYKEDQKRVLDQAILQNEGDALEIIEKVKDGNDFETTVKDKTGNTKTYAKSISFAKKDLSDEMAESVFSAKLSDIVGPFKSPLGYHVIKIAEIREPRTKPLEEVKDKISEQLTNEKIGNEIYELTSSFEDRLAAGEEYEALKEEYKLEIMSFQNVTSSDEELSGNHKFTKEQAQAIIKKIFQMEEGEPSSLADLSSSEFFSVNLNKVVPTTSRPFEEVKDLLLKRWTKENQARQNLIEAQILAENLNEGKVDLGNTDHSVKTQTNLARPGSNVQNSQNSQNLSEVFKDIRVANRFIDADEGKYIISIPSDAESIIIGIASDTKLGTPSEKDTKTLSSSLKADLSTANLMLFVTQLEKKYPVEINNSLLERLYANTGDQSD